MWQPIETAPKDGRLILVYFREKDPRYQYTVVFWKDWLDGTSCWYLAQAGAYAEDGIPYGDPVFWSPLTPPEGE